MEESLFIHHMVIMLPEDRRLVVNKLGYGNISFVQIFFRAVISLSFVHFFS